MKNLEYELSRARFKNSQCWAFTCFCTVPIMKFPFAHSTEYWEELAGKILYWCIFMVVFIFMAFALFYSYKIKKLEEKYEEKKVGANL